MKKILVFVLAMLLFVTACGNEDTTDEATEPQDDVAVEREVLEVAVIPAQSIGEMETGLRKLEETLAEKLDREVKVDHYPNYNAVVEALNYEHIDLAYLGPVTYLVAHDQSGAQAILTQEIDGEPFYYSYMITHVDNPWDSLDELLEDVSEIEFAFGSISSTSGSVIPSYELMQRGVFEDEYENEFKTVRYTGSHDITAQQVASKQVGAGAIDSAIFNGLVREGAINADDYKIIWQSEQLYQYPWAVRASMTEEEIAEIQQAFISITDKEILDIFGGASAFVEADQAQYDYILEVAKKTGMLRLNE
ncbi:phosphate/phosphite/phosphonate ABC transporter substrate-binding protein [Bacillus sp. FJAT-45350]|uniref:phosphate/phosphite/phosphonate ABC transporter substrate-binding protein n=1 Tax=Bacillus sp. FJAT-45350 TaxID=2011014 RepID=UPI000BB6D84F|nr:phosphate/phosphite/phosphonate ABC transporter substrate-binding protein [Bacillus sp. FJAT-45350]